MAELVRNISYSHSVLWVVQDRDDGHLTALNIDEKSSTTNIGNADFIICDCNKKQIEEIINRTEEAIHINAAFTKWPPMCAMALKMLCARHLKVVSLPLETYPWWGLKGLFRRLKWWYVLNISYGRKVKAIGYTGDLSYNSYRRSFVAKRRLFDFIYVTKPIDTSVFFSSENKNRPVRLLFVGQIIDRKNILYFTKVFQSLHLPDCTLSIIGTGPCVDELTALIKNTPAINYIGKLDNDEVKKRMCSSDVLVLPSKFDGWGAVVNEALQCGCRILVSDRCGVSSLMRNSEYGMVFKTEDKTDLIRCIKTLVNKEPLSIDIRSEIALWAQEHISGETVCPYFLDMCDYYFNNNKIKPTAPWN